MLSPVTHEQPKSIHHLSGLHQRLPIYYHYFIRRFLRHSLEKVSIRPREHGLYCSYEHGLSSCCYHWIWHARTSCRSRVGLKGRFHHYCGHQVRSCVGSSRLNRSGITESSQIRAWDIRTGYQGANTEKAVRCAWMEIKETKIKLLGQLDRICDEDTIIATISSLYKSGEFLEKVGSEGRVRVLNTHYFQPLNRRTNYDRLKSGV